MEKDRHTFSFVRYLVLRTKKRKRRRRTVSFLNFKKFKFLVFSSTSSGSDISNGTMLAENKQIMQKKLHFSKAQGVVDRNIRPNIKRNIDAFLLLKTKETLFMSFDENKDRSA